MKVATRITVATAVVVAIASASYAAFDLRSRSAERRAGLEREAKAVASTLRATIEPTRIRASTVSGWKIAILPRDRALGEPSTDATTSQLRRLRVLLDVPTLTYADTEDGQFYFDLALRGGPKDETTAMLEIAKPADVDPTWDDFWRSAVLVLLVVIVTTVMVGALASRFVSRPITKLLRGIDDVAKGDLSHVILSERDDEIGAIATRFNEMTFSLRESRAETERQNEAKLALEQRVGQSEKLATIGQLAAEIAHEVGTPLNVIAGRARSIQKKKEDPEAVEKNAGIVAEQTARITRIIQRLLDFTRRKVGANERGDVSVNQLIDMTIELLSGQIAHAHVRTVLEHAEPPPHVTGDLDRLQQVLINLLLNAVQSMPDGGALTVGSRAVKRTRPGLEDNAEQAFVAISVSDTGIGIPAEIKDKIFDPFYTTKEGRGGTGLGLAVCSGIVKEHDGWIDVEDHAGGGTVFHVYLPA